MKSFGFGALILATTILLSGCVSDYSSKASYLGGKALVEYEQHGARGTNDYITVTFYEAGSYHVAFSETPGKSPRSGRGESVMPKDFDAKIDAAPRVMVITQFV